MVGGLNPHWNAKRRRCDAMCVSAYTMVLWSFVAVRKTRLISVRTVPASDGIYCGLQNFNGVVTNCYLVVR
jgi:hypothetical protein